MSEVEAETIEADLTKTDTKTLPCRWNCVHKTLLHEKPANK